MKYLLIPLYLAAAMTQAEESRPAVSTLEWPGGPLPLAETLQWLNQSGNETTMAVDSKPAAANSDTGREFPFSAGSYWEGVVAAMEHHGLQLDRGDKSVTFHRSSNQNSGIQHPNLGISPVKLKVADVDDGPRHYIPAGPVLLEIKGARLSHYSVAQKTSIEVGYFAHLEPRYEHNDVGYVAITWKPLGEGKKRIPWPNSLSAKQRERSFSQIGSYQGRIGPNVIRSQSTELLDLNRLDLEATCEVAFTELRSSEHTLDVGETATFSMDDATADWTISFEGPSERQPRYHQVVMEVPTSQRYQGAIKIEATDKDGKRIHSSGRTTNWASELKTIRNVTYLQAPKSLPVTFKIEVRSIVAKTSHPLSGELIFPR